MGLWTLLSQKGQRRRSHQECCLGNTLAHCHKQSTDPDLCVPGKHSVPLNKDFTFLYPSPGQMVVAASKDITALF